ncbi:hypothetical protein C4565_00310 [Candidatus Parcubacteria bacterium]|nr:MAG: hypothetical protein C4565_00310 [Candidatus Parcubacteria bacterium]
MNKTVRVKDYSDVAKFLNCVQQFNRQAIEETGESEYYAIHRADWEYHFGTHEHKITIFGDPYDLGAFMINCFTQKIWQGGCSDNALPVWDGTYDPNRSSEEELMKDLEEAENQ